MSAGGFSASLGLDSGAGNALASAISGVTEGWEFTLDVSLSNIKEIEDLSATISYDPQQLIYNGVLQGSLFPSVSAVDSSGVIAIAAGPLDTPIADVSGPLCGLRFTTRSSFTGTTVQLTEGWVTRKGRLEELEAPGAARLSARNCDYDGDGEVGFVDFLSFARTLGATAGQGLYEARFDLDRNDRIDFADFLLFAQDYSTTVVQ